MTEYNPTPGQQFRDYQRNSLIMGIREQDYVTNMQVLFDDLLFFTEKALKVAPLLKKLDYNKKLVDMNHDEKTNKLIPRFETTMKFYNYDDLLDGYVVHYKFWIDRIIRMLDLYWDDFLYYIDFHFKMMKYKNRSLPQWFDRRKARGKVDLNKEEYLQEVKTNIDHFIKINVWESTSEVKQGDLAAIPVLIDVVTEFKDYFRHMKRFSSNKARAARRGDNGSQGVLCSWLSTIANLSYDTNLNQLSNVKYHMTELKDELPRLEKKYLLTGRRNEKKRGNTVHNFMRDMDW